MALTKVTDTVLFAIASISANSFSVGSAVDVSSWYEGDIRIHLGRGTGTAFTTSPKLYLQKSYKSSPNANDWITENIFSPTIGANIGSSTISSGGGSGSSSVTLTSATNFTGGELIFWHNGTIGSSEFSRVNAVSGNVLTLEEALTVAQTSSTCRSQAEEFTWVMSLLGVQKLRIIAEGAGGGQAFTARASLGAVSAL